MARITHVSTMYNTLCITPITIFSCSFHYLEYILHIIMKLRKKHFSFRSVGLTYSVALTTQVGIQRKMKKKKNEKNISLLHRNTQKLPCDSFMRYFDEKNRHSEELHQWLYARICIKTKVQGAAVRVYVLYTELQNITVYLMCGVFNFFMTFFSVLYVCVRRTNKSFNEPKTPVMSIYASIC